MRAVAGLILLTACSATPGEPQDPALAPMDPGRSGATAGAPLPCHTYTNHAGDLAIRAIAGVTPAWGGDDEAEEDEAQPEWIVLASGGPAGGIAPMRIGAMGAAIPLMPSLPGTCKAVALAAAAPRVAAVCSHDPTGANPDGGDEILLIDSGGSVEQVTSGDEWERMSAVALDAAGRRLTYLRQGELWLVELEARVSALIDDLLYAGSVSTLRMSDDGTRILVGVQTGRQLAWYDVATRTPHELPVGGAWIYNPEGDLDASGRVAVWLTSVRVDGTADDGVELRIADLDTGEQAQLTQLPAGPARITSPRLARSRDRVALLATSSLDATNMAGDWGAPHLIVLPLDGAGIDRAAAIRDFPLPAPAGDLTLDPSGLTAVVRLWYPSYGGASLVAIDLETGELTDLVQARGTGDVIDLSPDGRFAAVRRQGQEPAAALWPTDGGAPIDLPWPGAVARGGVRVAAMRSGSSSWSSLRTLRVYDVDAGDERDLPELYGAYTDTLGPAGLLLADDGRRALVISSFDLDRHPVSGGDPPGRFLYLVDLDGGARTRVAAGLAQLPNVAALDGTGRFVAYWTGIAQPEGSPEARATLILYDSLDGSRTLAYESPHWTDGDGAIALSSGGGRLAFCATFGYEAPCRLALIDLTTGELATFPGLDVQGTLAVSGSGETTFVGETPEGRGLHRFDPASGRLTRLAPPVMVRATIRGDSCAWNAADGGAIVARPAAPPATPPPVP